MTAWRWCSCSRAPAAGGRPAMEARRPRALLVLILVYRGDGVSDGQSGRTGGSILGLIGWAYLVAAAVPSRRRSSAILVTRGRGPLLVALADEANAIGVLRADPPVVFVGRMLGAHGAHRSPARVFGLALRRHRDETSRRALRRIPPWASRWPARSRERARPRAARRAAGVRDQQDPRDVRPGACSLRGLDGGGLDGGLRLRRRRRASALARAIAIAGENALVIYLLAPFLLVAVRSLIALGARLQNRLRTRSAVLAVGVVRSVVFAVGRRAPVRLRCARAACACSVKEDEGETVLVVRASAAATVSALTMLRRAPGYPCARAPQPSLVNHWATDASRVKRARGQGRKGDSVRSCTTSGRRAPGPASASAPPATSAGSAWRATGRIGPSTSRVRSQRGEGRVRVTCVTRRSTASILALPYRRAGPRAPRLSDVLYYF